MGAKSRTAASKRNCTHVLVAKRPTLNSKGRCAAWHRRHRCTRSMGVQQGLLPGQCDGAGVRYTGTHWGRQVHPAALLRRRKPRTASSAAVQLLLFFEVTRWKLIRAKRKKGVLFIVCSRCDRRWVMLYSKDEKVMSPIVSACYKHGVRTPQLRPRPK